MGAEPIFSYKKQFNISSKHARLISYFIIGLLSAIVTNIIGDGFYTAREIKYAELSIATVITSDRSAIDILINLLAECSRELIALALVTFSAVTVFPDALSSTLVLFKGFAFGRSLGALTHLLSMSRNGTVLFILSCIYLLAANLLFMHCCFEMKNASAVLRSRNGETEVSILCSLETIKLTQLFLITVGSIIIVTFLKSVIIWLMNLL